MNKFRYSLNAASLLIGALTLLPSLALASPCADEARYATNGAGQAFCLYEDMILPAAESDTYCHYLEDGYIGYSWTANPETAAYTCPAGAYLASNLQGTDYCVFDELPLPLADNLAPYCHYLEDGYIGYLWDICPAGSRYAENGDGLGFCLFEELTLPDAEVDPYCHWLEYGYIGFSWTESSATADYTCPGGSRYATNGAGLGFCVFDDLWLPPSEDLSSYCDYLSDGYIGYSWSL